MMPYHTTPLPEEEGIHHYTLPHLFPDGQRLVLEEDFRLLLLLGSDAGGPLLLHVQQFTDSEINLLYPFLTYTPAYTPYEALHACYSSGQRGLQEKAIARSRKFLLEAAEAGTWDQEMRPVRGVLSRLRIKLHVLDLDIKTILRTGYALWPQGKPFDPGVF